MDPWADAGTEEIEDASKSRWQPSTTSADHQPEASSSRLSPTDHKYSVHSNVDPWAENDTADHAISSGVDRQDDAYERHATPRESQAEDEGDFDPWGGQSAPIAPLAGIGSSTSRQEDAFTPGRGEIDEEGRGEEVEVSSGWRPSVEAERTVAGSAAYLEPDAGSTTIDETDPWGSGTQARRVKDEQNAEDMAAQMEIIRLQEEAKGKAQEQPEEGGEDIEGDEKDGEAGQKEVKNQEQDAAPATSASTGWRSFFTRSAAKGPEKLNVDTKVSETEPRASQDSKETPQSTVSSAAPRLWQAPSLRINHGRTASNTSQGSGVKDAAPTSTQSASATTANSQGPGWEVTTKKQQQQQTSCGGFMSNFLGSSQQAKEGASNSALSRIAGSLQRPPVVSAADGDLEDDSVDVQETGIEWEGGDIFEKKQSVQAPPPDLLSSEPAQESAMSRIMGRWRGKPQQQQNGGEGMSSDDLSWLDQFGDQTSGAVRENASETGVVKQSTPGDDDWLQYLDGNGSVNQGTKTTALPAQNPNGRFHVTVPTRKPPQASSMPPSGPTPRLTSPPQTGSTVHGGSSLTPAEYRSRLGPQLPASMLASPEMGGGEDESFGSFRESPRMDGSYRDEPDSHNDALLNCPDAANRNHKQAQRGSGGRQTSFLSNFGAGRPVRPYTFDEEDEEEGTSHNDNWTAFKDHVDPTALPKQTAATVKSPVPASSASPARSASVRNAVPQSKDTTTLHNSPRASGGILPPPPSSRPPPTSSIQNNSITGAPSPSSNTTQQPIAKSKVLSQGTSLTNDDLSFFENL